MALKQEIVIKSQKSNLICSSYCETMILPGANNACNWITLLFRSSIVLLSYSNAYKNFYVCFFFKNSPELRTESIRLSVYTPLHEP